MDCVKLVLFFMLYPFLCQLAFSSSLPHLCPKDQAHALLQFKHMFTFNPNASDYCFNPTTLSWNKTIDCCSWNSVHCDEMTGQVVELDLSCSGLQGKFHSNSSLFQLSSLKWLDLSYNYFSGSLISAKFGELSSLTHLNLLYSSFTGVIPEEISHLSKLQVLSISTVDPYRLRLEPYNFQLLLKNLTQLRELKLLFVNISSTIPLNFSFYLTSLSLSDTQLRGVLPERVFHLSNLEELYLPYNSLTGPIPSNEFKSKTLYAVILKQNQLQGPIPTSVLDQQGLNYLILSQNNLSGQIASTVCNLKTLRVLDLRSNHFNGTIPHCLGEMSALQVLDLNNNRLSGTINTTFNTENQLSIINLYGNKLKGKVPPSLINCRYLELLDLGNNELNDTFPSWLGGLPDLKILSLRSNKLHGPISDSRTDNLFAQIRVIDLSSNGFSGNLPVSLFGNFQAMKIIGHIPASFHQLSVLESLDLSSNKIGGEIPQQLASLTFLAVLNLSHNHLVGCIPKGKQFDTFENSSYQGNDGLRGFPLSKDCGGDDGVPQATTPVELDDDEEEEEEEEEGDLISWLAVLMGFGCGLVIGLSIIYIMLSTHYPVPVMRIQLFHGTRAQIVAHGMEFIVTRRRDK
ncbi:hypothetical protein BC332_31870 [Capsicum chinense]|nr:hypothetical protein BC332_31870 [Capsicum chinense]